MKIGIVGPAHPYKGGGAQHTTELAHRLTAAGHDVTIESWGAQYPPLLYPGSQTVDEPEGALFQATRRDLSWRRPDSWWRAGRRLREADRVVFVVLTPVQVPAYLGILAAIRRRTATVALCHNVLPHERHFYDRPLMRLLLRSVTSVLVHSLDQAALAGTLTKRPVRVADMAPHLPVSASREETDYQLRNRLLFFGLVRPYKGLDVLLRALAVGPGQVSLIVAGEFWGGLAETQRLIGQLGLLDRVDLRPGYVPAREMPSLFAAADALVVPYRSATGSQNVWMAHAYGLPVIATRVGPFPEQIREGIDGLLCEPDDVSSLAEAITQFYASDEPARLRAGVRSADPGPTWAAYVDALTAPRPSASNRLAGE